MYVKAPSDSKVIPINRNVGQGDTLLPRLLTTLLRDIFKSMDRSNKDIKINGKHANTSSISDLPVKNYKT